jgi:hypothetical protein
VYGSRHAIRSWGHKKSPAKAGQKALTWAHAQTIRIADAGQSISRSGDQRGSEPIDREEASSSASPPRSNRQPERFVRPKIVASSMRMTSWQLDAVRETLNPLAPS